MESKRFYFSKLAGIIWLCGAASMTDCQVLVEPGMTKPNAKAHSKREKKSFDGISLSLTVHEVAPMIIESSIFRCCPTGVGLENKQLQICN